MAAVVLIEGEAKPYKTDFIGGQVCIQLDGLEPIQLSTPLRLSAVPNPEDYDAYLLLKPDVKENDVKQIKSKIVGDSARIGWLIPVLSLVSNQHDYSENVHFLRYAFIAIMKAMSLASESVRVDIYERTEIDVLSLLGENSAVLVISKRTLVDGHDFDLKRAIPSLVSQGYTPYAPGLDIDTPWLAVDNHSDHLKIVLSSKNPDDHDMISAMLSGFVSSQKSAALQFFYLYQIVELLMDRVISIRRAEIAQSIIDAGKSSSLIRSALEKIVDINSERSRMNLVVDKYSRAAGDLGELKSECNRLNVKLGIDSGSSISDYLYPIRNYIFHNFRAFPPSAEKELRAVNSALLGALPILLSKFDDANI